MQNGMIIHNKYDLFHVLYDESIFLCKPTGKLKFSNDIPLVGDYVIFDKDKLIITEIIKRKNQMIRPRVANVDSALILMSIIEPDFDFFLLTKYLIQLEYNNINDIIICLTKTDLVDLNINKFKKILEDLNSDKYKILLVNDSNDFEKIKFMFENKKIILLIGQTGVGKSTLINKILKEDKIKTQEISKSLNRGKHTTTSTSLFKINNGFIVDTPGFSSFETFLTKEQLSKSFNDFFINSAKCKYNNCLHDKENNCEIKKMLDNNMMSEWRYNNYLKILRNISNAKKK